ncbi:MULTISPECIES: high-affinity branched-chain amino acid ABC transporter permease LivM [unclassified Ensifer]|uniref:high-affinity branched-chain amino acid ABC transporter permease LivM n=1 Tax=unclassified Ensifer TaxID=2633371 RepID=UPI0008919BBE|nr:MULTISPECIES: high-affinity branched-chain amino acid ABC transporter permease LivM [unclassified Ensifer]MBD9597756.1 high-affinity branched-chain amino acid ABC transporter permease LivM [Ensifer sp. ENS05]SDN89422.1 branched-chain amino acid transport system permease protein [Ensifer sp. YR511]
MEKNPLPQLLKQALLTFTVSLILFGPISGLVLEGFSFHNEMTRAVVLAAIVTIGRVAISLIAITAIGQRIIGRVGGSGAGVTVMTGSEKSPALVLALLFVAGLALPLVADKYFLGIAILALIYCLLGLGLNIVVGLAGLLDLGFVAFYAVGAYLLALGAQYLGLGFWSALVIAPLLAGFFGMILAFPVLKMHGDYLAIVTLGFGEIIRLVLNNWLEFTGGPNGAPAPAPTFLGIEFTRTAKQGGVPLHEYLGIPYSADYKFWFIYIVLFLVVCLVIYAVERLRVMPLGRMWEALREDEIACRSLGVNHVFTKLTAFMLGASTGGLAGVFFAVHQGFVNPTSFTFFESALILAIVVLGGLGSTVGVIAAALVLTILPELLRDFAEYRVLVFGVLMVVMMIWKPRGLVRIKRPAFFPSKAEESRQRFTLAANAEAGR